MELCEYELEREKNIEERNVLFASLFSDIMKFREEYEELAEIKPPEKLKKKHSRNKSSNLANRPVQFKIRKAELEPRKSPRVRREQPTYNENDLDDFVETTNSVTRITLKHELNQFTYKKILRSTNTNTFTPHLPVTPIEDTTRAIIKRDPEQVTDQDIANIAQRAGKKIYSKDGTSCHQCRQKTIDTKTVCRGAQCIGKRGQFCGPCLKNRYGELAAIALRDSAWTCPPCRNICNCSICRGRAGVSPTGILTPTILNQGFTNVKDFLNGADKPPDFSQTLNLILKFQNNIQRFSTVEELGDLIGFSTEGGTAKSSVVKQTVDSGAAHKTKRRATKGKNGKHKISLGDQTNYEQEIIKLEAAFNISLRNNQRLTQLFLR